MNLAFEPKPFETDAKRFYVPGAVLTGSCPKCAVPYRHDFGEQYLSSPMANVPEDFACWCGSCDHEWTVRIKLDVTLVLVEEDTPR